MEGDKINWWYDTLEGLCHRGIHTPDNIQMLFLSMDLDKIKVPVLIAAHENDKCGHTPPGDSDKLKAAMINSNNVKIVYFSGGKKPKIKPCQWFSSPHGFYGIEDKVADAVFSFVQANNIYGFPLDHLKSHSRAATNKLDASLQRIRAAGRLSTL